MFFFETHCIIAINSLTR